MAHIDPTLVEQIPDVSERKWEADVEHYRQADDLRARLKVAEWGAFGHPATLRDRPARLKQSSSDNTGTAPCIDTSGTKYPSAKRFDPFAILEYQFHLTARYWNFARPWL